MLSRYEYKSGQNAYDRANPQNTADDGDSLDRIDFSDMKDVRQDEQ